MALHWCHLAALLSEATEYHRCHLKHPRPFCKLRRVLDRYERPLTSCATASVSALPWPDEDSVARRHCLDQGFRETLARAPKRPRVPTPLRMAARD